MLVIPQWNADGVSQKRRHAGHFQFAWYSPALRMSMPAVAIQPPGGLYARRFCGGFRANIGRISIDALLAAQGIIDIRLLSPDWLQQYRRHPTRVGGTEALGPATRRSRRPTTRRSNRASRV